MTMNRLSVLAAGVLLTGFAGAQQRQAPDQEEMKTNYQELLDAEWYQKGGWTTDFDAAKAKATKLGVPILAYFTRTYAF